MNIKELINKWENKKGASMPLGVVHSSLAQYNSGFGIARAEIIEDLKELDEQQKLIIPSELHEYIKENKGEHVSDIFYYDWLVGFEDKILGDKVAKWLFENDREENNLRHLIAVQAFITGDYEVMKEPLYVIKKDNGYLSYICLGKKSYERNYTKNKKRLLD